MTKHPYLWRASATILQSDFDEDPSVRNGLTSIIGTLREENFAERFFRVKSIFKIQRILF